MVVEVGRCTRYDEVASHVPPALLEFSSVIVVEGRCDERPTTLNVVRSSNPVGPRGSMRTSDGDRAVTRTFPTVMKLLVVVATARRRLSIGSNYSSSSATRDAAACSREYTRLNFILRVTFIRCTLPLPSGRSSSCCVVHALSLTHTLHGIKIFLRTSTN